MPLRKLLPLLALGAMAVAWAQPTTPTTSPLSDRDTLTAAQKLDVLNRVNQLMSDTAFVPGVDFSKWPEELAKHQADLDKAESPRDFVLAVNKALRSFGLSHMVLSTPQAANSRRTRRAVGMGIQIQPEENGIRVVSVFPGSGAAEAGLQPGDLIMEADGKEVRQPTDLAGDEGQTHQLKLERNGKTVKVKVTRKPYSNVRPETLTWVNPETAVLRVWTFDVGYSRENVEKLVTEASKSKRLIVDLRSNPGGAVMNLTHLMGLLLPERTALGAFISRRDVDRYVKQKEGKPTDFAEIAKQSSNRLSTIRNPRVAPYAGKLAVLINGGSGSASEIAAIAMSEAGIPVIGEKSAGAVLASLIQPMPHGFALQYPIMDYVSSRGVRLEGAGVKPLLEANVSPKFGEKDEAIDKALLLLQRLERFDNDGAKASGQRRSSR